VECRCLYLENTSSGSLVFSTEIMISQLRLSKQIAVGAPARKAIVVKASAAGQKQPLLNVIPKSQWDNGIPPVMGAHLMASGTVAPISTSKGAGIDVPPHQFQYPGQSEAQVVVCATSKNAAAGLAKSVTEAAAAAIKDKGSFTLVLSGKSHSAVVCSLHAPQVVLIQYIACLSQYKRQTS